MAIYEKNWYIKLVETLRKWKWFDKYIYGRSKNIEDFYRNPGEVFFQEYCSLKECIGVTLLSLRLGFKNYKKELMDEYNSDILKYFDTNKLPVEVGNTYQEVPSRRLPRIKILFTNWVLLDATWFEKFYTKYPNSLLSLHIGFCKRKLIILPFICFVFRFWPTMYFQTGFGWAPESYCEGTKWDYKYGMLFFKLRIGNYKKELEWNPGLEVYGYWEGKC